MNGEADYSSYSDLQRPDESFAYITPGQDCSSLIQPEQSFHLLESTMLSLEVCLYHQVLPISLQGSRLHLGMVDPQDEDALGYIRPMLAYQNYTVIPGKISAQVHKDTLSAYLKYREQREQNKCAQPSVSDLKTPLDLAPAISIQLPPILELPSPRPAQDFALETDVYSDSMSGGEQELNSQETIFIDEAVYSADETVVIFTTPELEDDVLETLTISHTSNLTTPNPTVTPSPVDYRTAENHELLNASSPPTTAAPRAFSAYESVAPASSQSKESMPLSLDIQFKHLDSPIKILETLPPKEILDEVMGRVLSGGIGRLFFERHPAHGRIIWSQNGIVKAELEHLSLDVFQDVLQHLKQLHNLPLVSVSKTTRVEVERFYQRERLLLRLQLMPGIYGEEANLQILRGIALQFYQQRQLASVSRDALTGTQKLQQRLNEIYERAITNTIPERAQVDMLSALSKVVSTMDEQIKELDTLNSET